MLHRLVDELALDVLWDVLQEIDVATFKKFPKTLLHRLDIIWFTLSMLWERNSSSLPLRGSVAMVSCFG